MSTSIHLSSKSAFNTLFCCAWRYCFDIWYFVYDRDKLQHGGVSTWDFGYSCAAGILKTPPIHILNNCEIPTYTYISQRNHNPFIYLSPIDISRSVNYYLLIYFLGKIAPHWYIWRIKKGTHSSGTYVYTFI